MVQPCNSIDYSIYVLFLQLITEKCPIPFHELCLQNQVTEDHVQKLNRFYYVLEDNIAKQHNPMAFGGKANLPTIERYINDLKTEIQADPLFELYESDLTTLLEHFRTLLPEICNKMCAIELNLHELPFSNAFFYSIPTLKFTNRVGTSLFLDGNCFLIGVKMDFLIPNHMLFTQADTQSFFLPLTNDTNLIPQIYHPVKYNSMAFNYWFMHLLPSSSLQTQMQQYEKEQDQEDEPFCSYLNNDEHLIEELNIAHLESLMNIRHKPYHPTALLFRGSDATHVCIINRNSPSSDELLKTTTALTQLGTACLEFPHTITLKKKT